MKMDKSKTIEKINKLFILAENNANPGEKRSARAKAYQLMNQYDIDDSEVPFLQKQAEQPVYADAFQQQPKEYSYEQASYTENSTANAAFKTGANIFLRIFKGLFIFVKEMFKIPLVWQSVFVIAWFIMITPLSKHLMAQGQHELAWIMLIGSLIFFWHFIRNLLLVYLFCLFLYLVATTGIDYFFAGF